MIDRVAGGCDVANGDRARWAPVTYASNRLPDSGRPLLVSENPKVFKEATTGRSPATAAGAVCGAPTEWSPRNTANPSTRSRIAEPPESRHAKHRDHSKVSICRGVSIAAARMLIADGCFPPAVQVGFYLRRVRLQWNDLGTSARKTTKPENQRLVGQPQGGRPVRTRNPQ